MTSVAVVKKADLQRMADVANERNVTVEIVEGGRTIRVSPVHVAATEKSPLAPKGGLRF